jgi:SAM-dependent methyltransferase
MKTEEWDKRYRTRERPAEDFTAAPTPLVMRMAAGAAPGRALDLACGTGRNALWLAEHGWDVTAVDGAAAALDVLRTQAAARRVVVDARVADLEKGEFTIAPNSWDFVLTCYYLQRDLIESAKIGVRPGGLVLVIVHITEPGEDATAHRLNPGELLSYFSGWSVVHYYEGPPLDTAHRRKVAEVVARRPAT